MSGSVLSTLNLPTDGTGLHGDAALQLINQRGFPHATGTRHSGGLVMKEPAHLLDARPFLSTDAQRLITTLPVDFLIILPLTIRINISLIKASV